MQAAFQAKEIAIYSGGSDQTPDTIQRLHYVVDGMGPLRAIDDHGKFSHFVRLWHDSPKRPLSPWSFKFLKERLIVVSEEGLEPSRLPTRPSNVRVYQFRHP